jgi:hypothetical protein
MWESGKSLKPKVSLRLLETAKSVVIKCFKNKPGFEYYMIFRQTQHGSV